MLPESWYFAITDYFDIPPTISGTKGERKYKSELRKDSETREKSCSCEEDVENVDR